MGRKLDLVGQIFTRLTVTSQAEGRSRGQLLWNCLCECGNIVCVPTTYLTTGDTKSCGCLKREKAATNRRINLIGKKFGKLLVIKESFVDKKGNLHYLCKCDCGKFSTPVAYNLKNITSCGCLQREAARKNLTKHGLSHTSEYKREVEKRRREERVGIKSVWNTRMECVIKLLQPVCVICGSNYKMATDHVLPFSKGHRLEPGNAVRLCKRCNTRKLDKYPEELPAEMRDKILASANNFKFAWTIING